MLSLGYMFDDYLHTSLGTILLTSSHKGITHLTISDSTPADINPNDITIEAKKQLKEYFIGDLKEFSVPLDYRRGTPFNKSVWKRLLRIPYGQTISYKKIAIDLNNIDAIRAVGHANAINPIAIMIPCHRVIGSDGSLTGYAYGLEVKRKLLALENPRTFAEQGSLF